VTLVRQSPRVRGPTRSFFIVLSHTSPFLLEINSALVPSGNTFERRTGRPGGVLQSAYRRASENTNLSDPFLVRRFAKHETGFVVSSTTNLFLPGDTKRTGHIVSTAVSFCLARYVWSSVTGVNRSMDTFRDTHPLLASERLLHTSPLFCNGCHTSIPLIIIQRLGGHYRQGPSAREIDTPWQIPRRKHRYRNKQWVVVVISRGDIGCHICRETYFYASTPLCLFHNPLWSVS